VEEIVPTVGPPVVEHDVLSWHVTKLAKTLLKRCTHVENNSGDAGHTAPTRGIGLG
jgi:hypothetical protein